MSLKACILYLTMPLSSCVLYENNFNYEWNDKILNELTHVPDTVEESSKSGRKDLRDNLSRILEMHNTVDNTEEDSK